MRVGCPDRVDFPGDKPFNGVPKDSIHDVRSPHVRACDDGLREQDALHGPEAVRQLRDSLRLARHDQDLEAGLLVQVRVGRRPDGPKEIMLPMENAAAAYLSPPPKSAFCVQVSVEGSYSQKSF